MAVKDNYKNINDSFSTGFENDSNKELVHRYGTINLSPYTKEKIALEMNRRLIDEITEFNQKSSKQADEMIRLTEWIRGLTIVMLIGAVVQIGLLLYQILA